MQTRSAGRIVRLAWCSITRHDTDHSIVPDHTREQVGSCVDPMVPWIGRFKLWGRAIYKSPVGAGLHTVIMILRRILRAGASFAGY